MRNEFSRRWLIGGIALWCLVSASALAQTAVRVSSKIDTEGALLGSLMIQALESSGIKTENRLQLGNTKILRGAIVAGEVDLYPEYTGNGAFFFSDEKNPAWKNAAAGYELVKKLDAAKNNIVWLAPAPANNTWGIALRRDVAEKNGVKSLADLGKWLSAGGKFKLAASAEFVERSDALPANFARKPAVFDLGAAVHDDGEASGLGFGGGLIVAYTQLHPDHLETERVLKRQCFAHDL